MPVRKFQDIWESGPPVANVACDILAEDPVGEYRLPYACVWRDGAWYGVGKTNPLAIRVVGWRVNLPKPNKNRTAGSSAGS